MALVVSPRPASCSACAARAWPRCAAAAPATRCKVVVETPVNLDKRQRELLEEFRKSLQSDTSHSPKASGWFEGMKRFFDDL